MSHNKKGYRVLDKVGVVGRDHFTRKTKNLLGDEIRVTDAFFYNPDSKTSPKTALEWARRGGYWDGYKQVSESELSPEIRDNDPFEATIIDLDYRGRGGRAYKVIDRDNMCFDLREDQIIEIFKHAGVAAGGLVLGRFVWISDVGGIKLVLVGSAAHKKALEDDRRFSETVENRALGLAPTPGTLVPGHVYVKKDGSKHVFIGKFKEGSSTKIQYAFVDAPAPPPPFEEDENLDEDFVPDEEDNIYLAYVRKIRREWPRMTSDQRWDYVEIDRYAGVGTRASERHYSEITFMTTPKFDSEDTSERYDIDRFIKNENGQHRYCDNVTWDIVEKRNPSEPWNEYGYGYGVSFEQRREAQKKHQAKVNETYRKNAMAFRDTLKWLLRLSVVSKK